SHRLSEGVQDTHMYCASRCQPSQNPHTIDLDQNPAKASDRSSRVCGSRGMSSSNSDTTLSHAPDAVRPSIAALSPTDLSAGRLSLPNDSLWLRTGCGLLAGADPRTGVAPAAAGANPACSGCTSK